MEIEEAKEKLEAKTAPTMKEVERMQKMTQAPSKKEFAAIGLTYSDTTTTAIVDQPEPSEPKPSDETKAISTKQSEALSKAIIPDTAIQDERTIDAFAVNYGIENYCRRVRVENRIVKRKLERKDEVLALIRHPDL